MDNKQDNRTKSVGGIAPYGYHWQNGVLVIDSSEAPVRKLMFELFLKHKRKRVVAKLLNDLGYRTRSGSKFSDTTINRLLRDTTAKGLRIENGKEIIVEPIVSPELWQRANNLLGEKKTRPAVQLFTGLVFCDCGGRMIPSSNLDKYVCIVCKRKINSIDLEEIFISQLPKLKGLFTDYSLQKIWEHLLPKEKRVITENILKQITVGRTDIQMEFAVPAHSFKTPPSSQQNPINDKTLSIDEAEEITPSFNEPLVNEAEAAKFLGISKMTLLRRRNAGEIGFYRLGFRILYSKEKHLIPFLNKCEK